MESAKKVFEVAENESGEVMTVMVDGVAMININRTYEGVIVDVYDKTGANSLGSVALDEFDMSGRYDTELDEEMSKYDAAAVVDAETIFKAYRENKSYMEVIQEHFQTNTFPVESLTAIDKASVQEGIEPELCIAPCIPVTEKQCVEAGLSEGDVMMTIGGELVLICKEGGSWLLKKLTKKSTVAHSPLLHRLLHNKCDFTQSVYKFKQAGFHIYQDSGDYTDFECDVTYETKEENGDDRYSLNLHVTFNWGEKVMSMSLGENLGSGFESYAYIEHDGLPLNEQIERCVSALQENEADNPLLQTIGKHADALEGIKDAASRLSLALGITD